MQQELFRLVKAGVLHGRTAAGVVTPILCDSTGRVIISTGSGAYPESTNFAALPDATLHTGEIYIVLNPTGVIWVNRKKAGQYISDGASATDWRYLGIQRENFNDATYNLFNDSDNTKIVKEDLSGITTGTTHTYVRPDKGGTYSMLSDIPLDSDVVANTTHRGLTNNPHATDLGNLGSGTLAELNTALTDAVILGSFTGTVTTTDATLTTIATITMPDDTRNTIKAHILARRTDAVTSQGASYERWGNYFRDSGGVATQEGAIYTPFSRDTPNSLNGTINVSGNDVLIQVSGVAASTFDWIVYYEVISL